MSADTPDLTTMQSTCASCNSPLAAGAHYCFSCGARVAAPASTPPARLAERKFVTVVFIDMVGSLSAIRDKDPEDAHWVLSSALTMMSDAVHAYGGVVTERQGDGLMAVFGAPVALEDHATRACFAALRLHSQAQANLVTRISIRIGMNSGEVAVGSALNDFAHDYTATGAVVHIAARLQSLAAPNSTVMTAQTATLVSDTMRTESIGAPLLKGLDTPLEIHRLLGARSDTDLVWPPPPATFIGRDAPLATMEELLASAMTGHGLVLVISGEAGVGKTTLINAFASRHGAGISMTRSVARSHASAAPFAPFANVIRQLLRLDEVPVPERRTALHAALRARGIFQHGHKSVLLDLLDLETSSERWQGVSPLLRHRQIGAAVIRFLFAESRRRKLVIVLEDLQWADSATIELLDRLTRSIGRHPLMLIVAFRPETTERLKPRRVHHHLRLERLSDADTGALVSSLVGESVPIRVRQRLIDWSKGNPLFVRESVRAIAGTEGNPEDSARIEIPPTVGAVVAARIDRLPAAARRALLAGSVLGTQFAFDVLQQVVGGSEADLKRQLDSLVAEEFIRPLHLLYSGYAFDHGLFQEIAYGTLLRRQRRELHEAAFKALRRPRPAPAPIEELAHHSYGGELWTEAGPICREAGLRAASRYSNREAALHLERAIDALARADPEAQQLDLAIALRLELRSVSIPLLRMTRIGELLVEAQALAQRSSAPSQRATIAAFQAGHAYLTESPARCLELCRHALGCVGPDSDRSLRIAPTLYTAQALYGLGQYRKVVATLRGEATLQDASRAGASLGLPLRPLLMRAYWEAIALAELGRFEDANALATEMLELSDERQPFEALYSLTARGFVLLLRGELDRALESSTSAFGIAEEHDIAFLIPVLGSQVGYLQAMLGKAAEGLALAQRAVRTAEEIGINAGRSRWCARLAEACLAAKEIELASRYAETALAIAQEAGERGYLCSALRLRAKLRAFDGDLDGASVDVQKALDIARGLRLGLALAKCHFDRSCLLSRTGQLQEAKRGWEIAGRAFLRYGMTSGLRRVNDALGRPKGVSRSGSGDDELFGNAE